jgi:hypothetical protein
VYSATSQQERLRNLLAKDLEIPEEGHALFKRQPNKPISLKVRNFLIQKFNEGVESGRKHNSAAVAEEIRLAREPNGSPTFSVDDYVKKGQIDSL